MPRQPRLTSRGPRVRIVVASTALLYKGRRRRCWPDMDKHSSNGELRLLLESSPTAIESLWFHRVCFRILKVVLSPLWELHLPRWRSPRKLLEAIWIH